ncbi:siderophore-interacting protein [Asanoa siamensis]|uniref:SnoaL-like domain-containing protein n=1 Tax=Asanoa siamensis TaxID=926357 RepID=A0ABQ4CLE8_9ACTN|nr:siderophore-interacting protein [Asanoa siamensis]GIF71813.1 hypothetical protein Asi02nite_13310 [Asanoa siamensis]
MSDRHDDVLRGLARACRLGDVAAVRAALDPDAVAVCDSGGLVPAPVHPVHGAAGVARLLTWLTCDQADVEVTVASVNGRAGLALRRGGRAVALVAVTIVETGVLLVWVVLSPPKLRRWQG